MNKSVVWIHRGGPKMASYRYRALLPAKQIGHINGFECSINGGTADVLVFSKPVHDDLPMLHAAKKDGAKVIVDLCDDHFAHPHAGPLYRAMAQHADFIIAPTVEMQHRIHKHTGRNSTVIPDPFEEKEVEPHAVGDHLLWFGHKVNFQDIGPWMPYTKGWEFHAVSGPGESDVWREWTPENMRAEFAWANVVMLPTRAGSEYKTNNRLLNSVRAGCFVVCSKHPAHDEFKDILWVGDIRTGLRWCRAFADDLNALTKRAQDYIRDKYSPAAIAERWASVLEAV